jgi:hypothetical protein
MTQVIYFFCGKIVSKNEEKTRHKQEQEVGQGHDDVDSLAGPSLALDESALVSLVDECVPFIKSVLITALPKISTSSLIISAQAGPMAMSSLSILAANKGVLLQ